MSNKIKIIDSTLREGLQTPGVRLSLSQAQEIASYLNLIGVDMMEVGHPVCSDEHMRMAKSITEHSRIPCLVHARAKKEDILAAKYSTAQWVGIFAGVNNLSQQFRLGKSLNDILELIFHSVAYAKKIGLMVRYTVEDASRTKESDLLKAYETAINAGVDRICYSDTVGVIEPSDLVAVIKKIKNTFNGVELEVHLHDDRGLAMANSLSAVDAGVDWISTAVNGIGERCGITETLALMTNLDFRGTREYQNSLIYVKKLSQIVSSHSRAFPDARRPVIGKHAFTHTAKLHIDAEQRKRGTYLWRDPIVFGEEVKFSKNIDVTNLDALLNIPKIISAEELKYHTKGHGHRYLMIDDRFINDARQYCIVRDINVLEGEHVEAHVEVHRHNCDSLFMFVGKEEGLTGLTVMVQINEEQRIMHSPFSLFIPAGCLHTYQIIAGKGFYINHVLAGNYNSSLLEFEKLELNEKTV